MPYDYSDVDSEQLLRPPRFFRWLVTGLGLYTASYVIVAIAAVISWGPLGAFAAWGASELYLPMLASCGVVLGSAWVVDELRPHSIDRTAMLIACLLLPCLALAQDGGACAAYITAISAMFAIVVPLPHRPLHGDWYMYAGVAPPRLSVGALLFRRTGRD